MRTCLRMLLCWVWDAPYPIQWTLDKGFAVLDCGRDESRGKRPLYTLVASAVSSVAVLEAVVHLAGVSQAPDPVMGRHLRGDSLPLIVALCPERTSFPGGAPVASPGLPVVPTKTHPPPWAVSALPRLSGVHLGSLPSFDREQLGPVGASRLKSRQTWPDPFCRFRVVKNRRRTRYLHMIPSPLEGDAGSRR